MKQPMGRTTLATDVAANEAAIVEAPIEQRTATPMATDETSRQQAQLRRVLQRNRQIVLAMISTPV